MRLIGHISRSLYFAEVFAVDILRTALLAVTPRPREILAVVLVALSIFSPVMPATAQDAPVSAGVGQIVQPFIDAGKPQYAGATWDATLANAIASLPTKGSQVINMCNANGGPNQSQTIAANPFAAIDGFGGFLPQLSGTVIVCPGNYTVNQDIVLPTGWTMYCLSPHFGGSAATMGCDFIANMHAKYTAGTVTTAAPSCSGGCGGTTSALMTVTGIGTAWTSSMQWMRFAVCTTTVTGSACGGTTGSAASGLIQSVNVAGQTLQVLITNVNKANANASGVNYVIYPEIVQLGDNSSNSITAGVTGFNFGTGIAGFTLDCLTNTIDGCIGLGNHSSSNLTAFLGMMEIIPYNNACLYVGSTAVQNSGGYGGPSSPFWCTANSGTSTSADGIIMRTVGAFPVPLENFQVAMNAAGSGSGITGCAVCIDSQVKVGPGAHTITGGAGSYGVDAGDGITCPVICEDAPGSASGMEIDDLNHASAGSAAVKLGTGLTNVVLKKISDTASPANGLANLVVDSTNSVSVPFNDNSTNTLAEYTIDANGKSHTTAACSGCSTFVLPLANMSQLGVANAQTATYQLLASDFAGSKTIPVASGTFTITVVASTSQPASGQSVWVYNFGSGVVTVARSGQNLNGGTTSVPIPPGSQASPSAAKITSDGTNYEVIVFSSMTLGGVDSGAANAYVVTGGQITQLATGVTECFVATHASTTAAPTVAFNGLTATTITKFNGGALISGDIGTSAASCVVYNGSTFTLLNPQATTGNGAIVRANGPSFTAAISAPGYVDTSVGATTSAMGAQTTATLTAITNMSWTLVASKNYRLVCEIPVTFAASATIAFGLVGPGTPTSYNLDAYGLIGASAVFADINIVGQTTWVTTKTAASGAPGAVTEIIHLNAQIQNGTTAGAMTLDTSANGTNSITVGANAVCVNTQEN
jgi:hypothetical protein